MNATVGDATLRDFIPKPRHEVVTSIDLAKILPANHSVWKALRDFCERSLFSG
jgi:hypothetical protein